MNKRQYPFFMFTLLIFLNMNFSFAQSESDNKLTEKEKMEGWQLLFDGISLNNWRTFKNIPGNWKVINGSLCSIKPEGSTNPDIITEGIYQNFELSIDWNLSPKGNSGIMYLVTEDQDQTYESGPEYQLIDDIGFPHAIENTQHTGANYAMQAPNELVAKQPGEWNHTTIKVNNGRVEHWLNGRKIVAYEIGSPDWKLQKENSKWKEVPGYGMSKSGHIVLQASHSGEEQSGVCFKNIKLKKL